MAPFDPSSAPRRLSHFFRNVSYFQYRLSTFRPVRGSLRTSRPHTTPTSGSANHAASRQAGVGHVWRGGPAPEEPRQQENEEGVAEVGERHHPQATPEDHFEDREGRAHGASSPDEPDRGGSGRNGPAVPG